MNTLVRSMFARRRGMCPQCCGNIFPGDEIHQLANAIGLYHIPTGRKSYWSWVHASCVWRIENEMWSVIPADSNWQREA